jgi:hypothetical protein
VPASETAHTPYSRTHYAKVAASILNTIYRRHHIQKLVQMVAKAVGAAPQGRPARLAGSVLWFFLRLRAGNDAEPATA